jgi:hypothetical protein
MTAAASGARPPAVAEEPLNLENYFSLNTRSRRAEVQQASALARRSSASGEPPPPPEPMTLVEQIVMYLGVLVGVLFQPVLTRYRTLGTIDFTLPWGLLVVSLLIAVVVAPYVYEKVGVRRDTPGLIRFGLFAQQGLLWQVLLDAGAAAAKV